MVCFALFSGLRAGQIHNVSIIKKANVVFIGDSLTYGVGDTSGQFGYTGRVEKTLRRNHKGVDFSFENFGKPGDRSDQILTRINNSKYIQKKLSQANIIVLTVGGNDLRQYLLRNISISSQEQLNSRVKEQSQIYKRSLRNLFDKIRALNNKSSIFIFGNYDPFFVYLAQRRDLNDDVVQFNSINSSLSEYDQQKKTFYISIFRKLTFGQFQTRSQIEALIERDQDSRSILNNNDEIKNNLISTSDNFHPNNKGYDYMAKSLYSMIEKRFSWQK